MRTTTNTRTTFEVFYFSTPTSMNIMLHGLIEEISLSQTHKPVYRGELTPEEARQDREEWLDGLFSRFNDPGTNPLSHANDPHGKQVYIRENKLHTSMSVGDAVKIYTTDTSRPFANPDSCGSSRPKNIVELWACKGLGWEPVSNDN